MTKDEITVLIKEGADKMGLNMPGSGELASGKTGISIDSSVTDRLIVFMEHLKYWNTKMNLTAIEDDQDIVVKHFLDSMSILPYIPAAAKTFIDIGTGAGFPGIPVKIARPDLEVTLLDSLAKRISFLKGAAELLSLTGIYALHGRAEDYGQNKLFRESFDVASARAVAPLNVLCEYCLPFVKIGGFFIAMKAGIEGELEQAVRALDILGGEIIDTVSFTLPIIPARRNLIIIKKFRQISTKYPRKSGNPTKMPL